MKDTNIVGKRYRSRDWVLLFLKGIAMGAADVVPGVSGGTIAFISGIYNRLLNALKSLTPMALVILFKEGFRAFWQAIDGRFLVTLFGGILLFLLIGLYPKLMAYLSDIFFPSFIAYCLLFLFETATLYIYWYGWDALQGNKKGLHIFLGFLLKA